MTIPRKMLNPGTAETRQSILPEAKKMFKSRGVMISERLHTPGKSWREFYKMTRRLEPGCYDVAVQDSFVIGSLLRCTLQFHEQGLVADITDQARYTARREEWQDEVVADLFRTSICLVKGAPEHLAFFVESFPDYDHRYEISESGGRYVATIEFPERLGEAVDVALALNRILDNMVSSESLKRAYEAEQAVGQIKEAMKQLKEGNRFIDATVGYLTAKMEDLSDTYTEARRALLGDAEVRPLVPFIVKKED